MANQAAWNQGWQTGEEAARHQRDRKELLQDQDRQQKASDLVDTRNAILKKLPTLLGPNGEKTPEYDQAYQTLTQTQQDLGQLYHPDKAPGALQQDWHWLLGKMHGIVSPKDKAQAGPVAAPAPAGATTPPAATNVPKGATEFMAVANPKGMVSPGNIPIWNRPSVLNDDGTHSSELSISIGDDKGNQILIPLIVDGKFLTPDGKMPPGPIPHNAQEWEKASPEWKALKMRAEQHYQKTGEHLGKFGGDTAEDDVDAYAQVLHNRGSATAQAQASTPPPPAKAPTWGQAQLLKKQAASLQKAQSEASMLAAGAPLSYQQEAQQKFKTDEAIKEQQIDAALKTAERLGITGQALDEFKQQLAGLKNVVPRPLTGAAGIPYKGPDGLYRQNVTNQDGSVGWRQMPPEWKPQTKPVRGALVNTKQYGWIVPWLDAYNPNRIVGFQKVTPSRYYGGTKSEKTSTDAFGVTTSSSGTTMPANTAPVSVDLSGASELPSNYNGEEVPQTPVRTGQSNPPEDAISSTEPPSGSPNKSSKPTAAPPASVAKPTVAPNVQTPAELKANVPAPPAQPSKVLDTDAQGHIPENALGPDGKPLNRGVREGANQLLDGVDIKDISVPGKDKYAAEALARQYGWGRGPYLPRELKQMQNADQFLDQALNSKAFMRAIDSGFFRKFQTAESEKDASKSGLFDTAMHVLSVNHLTKDQQEYLTIRQALMGTVSGLSSVVRTGRPTEATISRLMQEIPDVMSSSNSTMAKEKIAQIKKELKVALTQGVPAPQPKNASPSGGALDNYLKINGLPPLPTN